jgi:hypothetical protein
MSLNYRGLGNLSKKKALKIFVGSNNDNILLQENMGMGLIFFLSLLSYLMGVSLFSSN